MNEKKLSGTQRKMVLILFQINGYESAMKFIEFKENEFLRQKKE